MAYSISVIMPVFNAERYLKAAIDSVNNQTLQDFEFIIINDGSTDSSEEIILSYNLPNLRYVKNDQNSGFAYSLNKGIEIAKGNYLARMDADDICSSDRFITQWRFLEQNQKYGMCCSDVSTIDEKDKIIQANLFGNVTCPLEWEMLWMNPVAHPSVMIRKSTLQDNNLSYDAMLFPAEDYGLWCNFILKAPIKRLSEVLLNYRILDTSMFHSSQTEALEKARLSTNKYAAEVSGLIPPLFHSYFYYQGNDRLNMITGISLREAKLWLERLNYSLKNRHKWSLKDQEFVAFDINLKLLRMLVHKKGNMIYKIKSLTSLNILFSLQYLFLWVEKKIAEKLK